MKKKILISYVSYSNTSKCVAYNIYDKLDKKKYIVSLIDLSEYGSKINMFSNFLFKNNLELLSGLFLKLVNNKLMAISYEKQSIKCFDSEELRSIFSTYNPDLVLTTHYCASYIVTYYNRLRITNTKIISIVTDYTAHTSWIMNSKEIDKYVVSNEILKSDFIKKGVDTSTIYPYGLPSNLSASTDDYETILKKYSLKNDKPIYLFFIDIERGFEYFKTIIKKDLPVYYILATSKNISLKVKCEEYIYKNDIKNVLVLGYTKDITNLISVSDVIISKPGSSTINECILMGKPLILTSPSNSSEVFNMKYILKNHFGMKATTPTSLKRKISLCLNYPFIINSYRNKLKKISSVSSTEKICKLIYDTINE